MIIRSTRHRGLAQLLKHNSSRFLRQDLVDKVLDVIVALTLAENLNELIRQAPRGWRIHRLSGSRKNVWSISVSGNWRITFEEEDGSIYYLNLEDYH